jgi:hypothetical protein
MSRRYFREAMRSASARWALPTETRLVPVVGIVGDVHQYALDIDPEMCFHYEQVASLRHATW